MQRSLDLLALTKRLEMISTKPAVGRHFFRRFEFKGEKRRRSQAFYTGTSCLRFGSKKSKTATPESIPKSVYLLDEPDVEDDEEYSLTESMIILKGECDLYCDANENGIRNIWTRQSHKPRRQHRAGGH